MLDTVLTSLFEKKHEDSTETHRKAFDIMQGGTVVCNTCTMGLVRQFYMSRGFLSEITATTVIAASLCNGGRTFHSVLGLFVDDNENDESSTQASKYIPQSKEAEFLRKRSLLILDESSMIAGNLFETVNVNLSTKH